MLLASQAQTDIPTIVKKLNEAYQANGNMSVTTTYKMYANFTTTTAAQTLTGNLKKKGEQMSYKLENVERLESLHRRILVNHDSKTVIVQANDVDRKTYVMDLELEKYLNSKTQGQVQDQGTQLLLSMPVKLPDVEKVDMYINKSTFLINKLVVYYRQAIRFNAADESTPKQKPRMEIAFQINLNPTFANNEFNENKFIRINNGVMKLNNSLTDYQLVNFDKD